MLLAAGFYVHMLTSAAAAQAEQLVAFGDLPERLRSVAIEAFADADDPAGRSASATAHRGGTTVLRDYLRFRGDSPPGASIALKLRDKYLPIETRLREAEGLRYEPPR